VRSYAITHPKPEDPSEGGDPLDVLTPYERDDPPNENPGQVWIISQD
jgi:hypothetical protein